MAYIENIAKDTDYMPSGMTLADVLRCTSSICTAARLFPLSGKTWNKPLLADSGSGFFSRRHWNIRQRMQPRNSFRMN